MPVAKKTPALPQLKAFKKKLAAKQKGRQPRLILIIMANTLDKTLGPACKQDMKAVQTVFKNISRHFKFPFCSIEIAGKHYSWKSMDKVLDAILTPEKAVMDKLDDVVIFYYTGHGFSYKNDAYTTFPQLDIRPHSHKANFNSINFIKQQNINLEGILNMMRIMGGKINVAIGDCCNTTISYKRPRNDESDMWASGKMLPPKCKILTNKILKDDNKEISIIVSSSQFGQPAITDLKVGSIFTHFFTQALVTVLNTRYKGEPYIPWVKVLKKASAQAFKESKGYDVGGGVAGKQKAVFQAYVSKDVCVGNRVLSLIKKFEKIKSNYRQQGGNGAVLDNSEIGIANFFANLRGSLKK